MKLFLDFESTGINPYTAEIIEGFLVVISGSGQSIDHYHYKQRPVNWSQEAETIHNIDYNTAMTYPDKRKALGDLVGWLKPYKQVDKYCYANVNTPLGHIKYDFGLLCMELFDAFNYQHSEINKLLPCERNFSVHTLAVESERKGAFKARRNTETNRKMFSQTAVYDSLFNRGYNAHNAKADVEAMIEIYDALIGLDHGIQNKAKPSASKLEQRNRVCSQGQQGSFI